jgi:glycosyltransferase involved in cell wall biosynthesis
MNIWIFNHYAIAPGSSGGTRHYDLAKELVKQGHEVTIFASSFDHQTRKNKHITNSADKYKKETFNGVQYIWTKTYPYQRNDWRRVVNMLSYMFRVLYYSKKASECPDVVVGSLMHPLAAFIGYVIAKKKGSKFYFEERDLWPQTLIDLGKVSKRNPIVWFLSMLELFLYKKADRVIVLFDKAVNYVEQRGINREKITYLPNGVDLTRYNEEAMPIPTEIEEILVGLKDKFIAIYTGTHGLANNLDAILETAKILKKQKKDQIHFLLVGDGPEKKRLMKYRDEEVLDNVTFIPSVAKEQIPTILKHTDVGLLPLQDSPVFKWGISPNKMFDYMASKLPVMLLCDLDGSQIEKSGGGSVIRNDFSKTLANELLKYEEDREGTKEKGQKAFLYVEKHHSWKSLSVKFLEMLESEGQKA